MCVIDSLSWLHGEQEELSGECQDARPDWAAH